MGEGGRQAASNVQAPSAHQRATPASGARRLLVHACTQTTLPRTRPRLPPLPPSPHTHLLQVLQLSEGAPQVRQLLAAARAALALVRQRELGACQVPARHQSQ